MYQPFPKCLDFQNLKKIPKLACPARFERATYALEEFVAVQNINKFNGLSQKYSTVQQTV